MDAQVARRRSPHPARGGQRLQRLEERRVARLRVLQQRPEQLVHETAQRVRALHLEQQAEGAQRAIRSDSRATACPPGQPQRLARLEVRSSQLAHSVRQVADADRRRAWLHDRRRGRHDLRAELFDRRKVGGQLVRDQEHSGRRAHQGQGAGQARPHQAAERSVEAVLLPASRERGLGLVFVGFEHHDPRALRQAVTKAFGLPGDALRLVRLQRAGENFLDQIPAQPALDLRSRPLLRKLECEHGRSMLERAEAALGFAGLVVHTHRQEAEHIRAGAHGYDVQRAWRPARVDPNLAGRGAGSGREMDPRRHAIR